MFNSKNALTGVAIGIVALLALKIPFIGLFSSVLLVIGGVMWGLPCFIASCIILLCGSILLNIGYATAILLIITATVALFAQKRASALDALILCSAGALLGIVTYFCIDYAITGINPMIHLFGELPEQYFNSLADLALQMGTETAKYVPIFMQAKATMQFMIPATALMYATMQGFLLLLIPAFVAKKAKKPSVVIPRFSMWRLPNSHMWGILALQALSYMAVLLDWDGSNSMMMASYYIFSLSYFVLGLSVLSFLYIAYDNALIVIGGVFSIMFFAFMPMILLAFADLLFNLRLKWLEEHGSLPIKHARVPVYRQQNNSQQGED